MSTTTDLAGFWDDLADQLDPDLDPTADGLIPATWEGWLREMFPSSVGKPFADHHRDFWEWLWGIGEARPVPYVGIWPRGGGKSTNGELGVCALGARGIRRYAVVVSETQDQADKRVDNIAELLESESVVAHYPALGRRAVGKYGRAKAWRRNRLWTASGFIVDALGLDTAARGLKVREHRPDVIVLDDLDGRHDSLDTTKKKIATLTETILPIGAGNAVVLALQNLIIATGVFAKLASGEAEFLIDRRVSGPVPAIRGLETEPYERDEDGRIAQRIVGGEPTWSGQDLDVCQGLIDTVGLPAFNREQQHRVEEVDGALWTQDLIERVNVAPPLRRIVVGVDPSGGTAEIGIVAAGVGHDGRVYVVRDASQLGRLGPANWGRKTVLAYDELEADRIVAEKNFGGDMVESTIRVAAGARQVPVTLVTSSRGKLLRAEPVAALYEEGMVRHVGVFPELEIEMTRWVPGNGPSPNRLDALVFALTELKLGEPPGRSGASARPPGW